MKHLEIRTIETNGIKIAVQIDYDNKHISLVEGYGTQWKKKQYIFADRGLKYMKGWRDILHAMAMAINHAEDLLTEHCDAQAEEFVERMRDLSESGK